MRETQDIGSIPGSRRSHGKGNGNLLQYSCLGNPWTEETGDLQSMGSERIIHDQATKHILKSRNYAEEKTWQGWVFC